jgi:hypothetical protein
MNRYSKYSFIVVLFIVISCNTSESKIKKDLKSRWTEFEIINIQKDSANVERAINILRALSIQTLEANGAILDYLIKISKEKNNAIIHEDFILVDSIYNSVKQKLSEFHDMDFKNISPCFFVTYKVNIDGIEVLKEEYYYLNETNGDILHRSSNWQEFLNQNGWQKIIAESSKYYSDILELRNKSGR